MSGLYCSPNNINNKYTCFTNESLVKIAKQINQQESTLIHIPKKFTDETRKKLWKSIQQNMTSKGHCTKDSCIIGSTVAKKTLNEHELNNTLRYEMPYDWNENMNKWLSTHDILKVMKQYEISHPDFKFIGATPLDYDYIKPNGQCVTKELCTFNLNNYIKQGIFKIGVVFNLDPHYKSGSHWTSLYIDVKKGGIYYFDSAGTPPPKYILKLISLIQNQGNFLIDLGTLSTNDFDNHNIITFKYNVISPHKILLENSNVAINNEVYFGKQLPNKHFSKQKQLVGGYNDKLRWRIQKNIDINTVTGNKIINIRNNEITLQKKIRCSKCDTLVKKAFCSYYNQNKFQFKDSECGIYSMHFIEEFLNGKTFFEIINNIIYDDEINKKRLFYYRPSRK